MLRRREEIWGRRSNTHLMVCYWRLGDLSKVRQIRGHCQLCRSPDRTDWRVSTWRFWEPGERLAVNMCSLQGSSRLFETALLMKRHPMSSRNLAHAWLRFPAHGGRDSDAHLLASVATVAEESAVP